MHKYPKPCLHGLQKSTYVQKYQIFCIILVFNLANMIVNFKDVRRENAYTDKHVLKLMQNRSVMNNNRGYVHQNNVSYDFPIRAKGVVWEESDKNNTPHVKEEEVQLRAARRIVLCFPYNGEQHMVMRRMSIINPETLFVVSESIHGHNGELKKNLHWKLHFPTHIAQHVKHLNNEYNASSVHGRWAQEVKTRSILGEGIRNLYNMGNITDNDIVVVTDADEILSSTALAWLKIHIKHDQQAVADFRWFLFTHCYEHPKIVSLPVGITVKTLRTRFLWDAHKVRLTNNGMSLIHIDVKEKSSHCSWCFGKENIREKMRTNIEGSSWQSRGHSYVFSDAELDHMRSTGTWFDGKVHGKCICTSQQIKAQMATYDDVQKRNKI